MSKREKYSEDLILYITDLQDEQNLPHPSSVDIEDAIFIENLVKLAKTIKPDPTFTKNLKKQLFVANKPERRSIVQSLSNSVTRSMTVWRSVMTKRKRFVYAVALTLLLIVCALTALPSLAQFALEHFAPREVEKLPITGESVTLATIPSESYLNNVETLETQLGFVVLMPQYIPTYCHFQESYYLAEPVSEIHLVYDTTDKLPCFEVTQRKAQENMVHRPSVGPGSTEEITINGEPALYINGMWVIENMPGNETALRLSSEDMEKLFEDAAWVEGPQQLVFENNDLLIRIDAGPNISKEELVKIAESLE